MDLSVPLFFLTGALVAGVVTSLAVPLVVRLSEILGALDRPAGRPGPAPPVPRLGGVALALGLGAGTLVVLVSARLGAASSIPRTEFLGFAVALGIVFLVGFVDDLVGLSAPRKFLGQLAASVILVQVGWTIEVIRLPWIGELRLGLAGGALTVLWLVGVTNAINLVDGLDGLASGLVAIVAGNLAIYCFVLGNLLAAGLLAVVVGSCVGFLVHNWAPARIFLGDSGSLTLGFLLASLSLHSSLKAPVATAVLVPLLALGLPIFDTLLVMVLRFLSRPKRPFVERFLRMFQADRSHLHHLLTSHGMRRQEVVRRLWAATAAGCLLALWVGTSGQSGFGWLLLVLGLLSVMAVRMLGLDALARERALASRQSVKAMLLPVESGIPGGTSANSDPKKMSL